MFLRCHNLMAGRGLASAFILIAMLALSEAAGAEPGALFSGPTASSATAQGPQNASGSDPSAGVDGLPPETMALLASSQDAAYESNFVLAESLASQAVAMYPDHPLPRIFLQMAILASIQDADITQEENPLLYMRFEKESQEALALATQRELKSPDDCSVLYLGSCIGASGLVKMFQGHYMDAYHDGQMAASSLVLALQRNPAQYDAYLGLGQYNYYCGRLAGPLRLFANLHGDIQGGIHELELCGFKGDYAATAARSTLARIYSMEEINFAKALPYVSEMRVRYPDNCDYIRYAMATAQGLGWEDPRGRILSNAVFVQWDQGWRPPLRAHLDLERARLRLARFYFKKGHTAAAMDNFAALAASTNPYYANAGRKGLNGLR
jgi:hypothetical protein